MRISTADRNLQPNTYLHDASEISRFGRNSTIFLGSLVLVSEGLELLGDVVNDQSIENIPEVSGILALTVLGASTFHVLHKKLGARSDKIQGTVDYQPNLPSKPRQHG